MRDNRFSMAPKNTSNNNINRNVSNNQSNIKQGNDSKNRKSTNPMMFPRATTFSSVNKASDPRPIKENHFQEECITKILDFLIKEAYDKIISKKDLMSPGAKDFLNLFTFIVNKIRPDWNLTINKLDEDIIPILNELRYPGYITKSHLVAVGAPNTWPHLLAVLAWLVELANYLFFDDLAEREEAELDLNFQQNFSENNFPVQNQEKFFESYYKEFLNEGYKQSLTKGDSFSAVEVFQKKTDELIKLNYSNSDKLITETQNLEKLIEELDQNYPSLNETQLKFEMASRDVNNLKINLNNQEKKLHELCINLENKIKFYDTKCEKNKELTKSVEELDSTVKNQKVSYEEFEKLKYYKANVEKECQGLTTQKQELNETIWNIKNNIENLTKGINEKIKNISTLSDKLQLNKEDIISIISNEINKNSALQTPELDMAEVSNNFLQINSNISNFINSKLLEVKERQEFLINLKSDLLKLDDKINEANEILLQKSNENEQQKGNLQSDKDKYAARINEKNEEIKKINDQIQKILNVIAEREKEYEEVKSKESILSTKYQEEEEATDLFLKELENDLITTFKDVENQKNENVRNLRKLISNINSMFEGIKNNLKYEEQNYNK
jgi:SMC interacting uncharacterized protein involved in chromosome segregation